MKKSSPPQMKEVSFPIHPLSSQEIIFIYSPRSHLPRSPLPSTLLPAPHSPIPFKQDLVLWDVFEPPKINYARGLINKRASFADALWLNI
jgi:hypothetical protein